MSYILFFLSFFSLLMADIRQHFKPTSLKKEGQQIENIDFIYMINLDERPEKYALSLEKLAPYGIIPHRFSAVNGWNLSLEVVNDLGVRYEPWMSSGHWTTVYPIDGDKSPVHELIGFPGRVYFSHCMSRGAMGIVLSHLSILQDALDSGYQTIWVMEDDIEVVQDPHLLSKRIEELDAICGQDGWDVLFTDPDTKNQRGEYVPCSSYAWRPNYTPMNPTRFAERRAVSEHLTQIGSRYGAYSMILRRSGMKRILNFFKCYQVFLPYDMEYTQPNIRLFSVTKDIVSTFPGAFSDNGAPNYLQKERK